MAASGPATVVLVVGADVVGCEMLVTIVDAGLVRAVVAPVAGAAVVAGPCVVPVVGATLDVVVVAEPVAGGVVGVVVGDAVGGSGVVAGTVAGDGGVGTVVTGGVGLAASVLLGAEVVVGAAAAAAAAAEPAMAEPEPSNAATAEPATRRSRRGRRNCRRRARFDDRAAGRTGISACAMRDRAEGGASWYPRPPRRLARSAPFVVSLAGHVTRQIGSQMDSAGSMQLTVCEPNVSCRVQCLLDHVAWSGPELSRVVAVAECNLARQFDDIDRLREAS